MDLYSPSVRKEQNKTHYVKSGCMMYDYDIDWEKSLIRQSK